MLKTFVTLFRGALAATQEEIVDRNALLVLDQQIRDATGAVARGKRELAVAVVSHDRERRRIESLSARITDFEERAAAALAIGRNDLATEAAEAKAEMEAEMENDRAAALEARAEVSDEIARLRTTLVDGTRRLGDLTRGRHIARAAEAARRLDRGPDATGPVAQSALAEAEGTLRRLRERQADNVAVDHIVDSFDPDVAATTLAARLEAAGCGPHTRITAAEVLARIGSRTKSLAAEAD